MSFPRCKAGFDARKLTQFAGGVVDDFGDTFHRVKKVVASQNTAELSLTDLGINEIDFYVLRVALLSGPNAYAHLYFNDDEDDNHYLIQTLGIFQGEVEVTEYYSTALFYISDVPHQYVADFLLTSGPPTLWIRGADIPNLRFKTFFWLNPFPPLDKITLKTLDPDTYIPAGSWIEIWR
jgi:hypothetical protein